MGGVIDSVRGSGGIIVAADRCCAWSELSWGRKGNFCMRAATAWLVPYHVGEDFALERGGRAWKTDTSASLGMYARLAPMSEGGKEWPAAEAAVMVDVEQVFFLRENT